METILRVENLTKAFNGFTAVDGISFDMKAGEILGIIGPNGAGKTTTLQMITGLTTPTRGSVEIFGLPLADRRKEILQWMNFSSSYVSLPYSLTVRENLMVYARLYGVKDPKGRIDELLESFEITELGNRTTRKLSSGQMTRVCLCKALINAPRLLLLDEPTASLDPDISDKTRTLLRRIKTEEGVSILYTSHNMKETEEMCDRVVFLDRGRILATDVPDRILKKFKGVSLEEVFLKVARNTWGGE